MIAMPFDLISSAFSVSSLAMAPAFDGEIAIPATPLAIRSETIWISPASSEVSAGPVYTHSYSELAFSSFHLAQPLPITVKKPLSRPFTTTANVFFCAIACPAPSAIAAAATINSAFSHQTTSLASFGLALFHWDHSLASAD